MRLNLTGCALGLVIGFSFSADATIYHVAQRNPKSSDDAAGTLEQPWQTIDHATSKIGPGDTVIIHGGVYREDVIVKASGTEQEPIVFEAAPGAHVVVTGADRLTGWQKSDDGKPIYRVPWTHRFITWSKNMTHPDDDYHRLIGRCEQVMVDGYPLRQVLEADQLARGTFFVEVSNQVLKAWDAGSRDLNKAFVEASTRQEIFRVEGAYVQLRGLHFRFAANMAQHGAVVLAGDHDVMEDCVMEQMNSNGATFSGPHQIVRRCVFRDNGQLGFGANGAHDLLFTECLVENNNTKDFDRGWEAGGDKLVLCRHAVLERSRFVRNRGNGIWFDIGNEQCVVRNCLIADNEDSGIFYEISFGLHAHDNVIFGNGFAETSGAWGAQAGISLSSSPDCVIERNLIVGNREGFNFREQTRSTPRIGRKGGEPVWNHDETIRRNIIALNRDNQIRGWFDVKDGRQWPAANNRDHQSEGLTLKKLRLRFKDNDYFAEGGQGWFAWGVSWARHKSYSKLDEFQTDLGIDQDGRVLEPTFANPSALDFRLPPDVMKNLRANYPVGTVPGVILGVRP